MAAALFSLALRAGNCSGGRPAQRPSALRAYAESSARAGLALARLLQAQDRYRHLDEVQAALRRAAQLAPSRAADALIEFLNRQHDRAAALGPFSAAADALAADLLERDPHGAGPGVTPGQRSCAAQCLTSVSTQAANSAGELPTGKLPPAYTRCHSPSLTASACAFSARAVPDNHPVRPGQAAQFSRVPGLRLMLPVTICGKIGRSSETTMADASIKTPWHLWAIGVIAVLFNAIGLFDFVMTLAQGASYQARAGMTPDQIAHYQQMPAWMTLDWAIGVFGAFVASILLLLRSKLALPVFVLSLAAFLVSLLYTYVLTNGGPIMGPQMAVTSAVIAGLLVLFAAYSRYMTVRGVLR